MIVTVAWIVAVAVLLAANVWAFLDLEDELRVPPPEAPFSTGGKVCRQSDEAVAE